jgi:hypothetical protein
MVARPETPSLAHSNWVHSPHSNCSSKTFLLKNSLNTITSAAYSIRNQFFKSGPHNFSILQHLSDTSHTAHISRPTMSPPSAHNAPIAQPFSPHTYPVKSTQSISNFTKEDGDFSPPFEPSITADFTLTHPKSPAADPNPMSDAATNIFPMPYKPSKRNIIQISKDPSAFTPEQESPFFDYFIDLTITKEHIQATQDATQISSNHIKSNSVNKSIELTTNTSSAMPPAETYHRARNRANNFLHFAKRITSSPTISSKKELRTTLFKRLIKKPRIQDHHNEHNYNNDSNYEVAASDSFKIPAPNAEDLHNDKRGIIQTALERTFQGTSTIKNPTNTRVEIVRTVDAIKELIKDTHFSTLRKREDHKSDSDDDFKSSESSAFRNISTFHKTPRIDEDKAKSTTAKHVNDHCQNREFFTECPPDHPEQAKPLPSTTITQLPTTSAKPSRISFLPSPENVIPFLRHHNNAVIRDNNLVLTAATPPDTISCQTPGTSPPTAKNENTSTSSDDATNCPVPTSEIGPMSERDPPAKNAVSTSFNDDISDNSLDIINMSTTNSIYSQQSENSRNSEHSYASELTCTFLLTLQPQTESEQHQ